MMGGLHHNAPNQTQTSRKPHSHSAGGFTIVETMIVLAVTGILFISAVAAVAGRQNKTQFQQAVNAVKTEVEQTISDVQSGYYPNANNFTCAVGASGELAINDAAPAAATAQGANRDCVFLGKTIQFNIDGSDNYIIFPIAGKREASSLPSGVDLTGPKAIKQAAETKMLQYGIKPKWVKPDSGNAAGAVGFFTTVDTVGDTARGSSSIQLLPVPGSSLDQNQAAAQGTIDANMGSATPVNGVKICYESGTTKQHGIVSVSGGGVVSLEIKSGDCPA